MKLYNGQRNVGSIIESAMKKCGLYATGVGLSGEETNTAIDELNVLLQSLQNEYQFLSHEEEIYKEISNRSKVIGADGKGYVCVRSHKAIDTFDEDRTDYSNGYKVYNMDEDNDIIYEIATSEPTSKSASSDWPIDTSYYYSHTPDGGSTIYLYPVSIASENGYVPSAEPGVSNNISTSFWEGDGNSYTVVSDGDSVETGDNFVVSPSDKEGYYLFTAGGDFNIDEDDNYDAYFLFPKSCSVSSTYSPYINDSLYTSSDRVELPSNTLDVLMVSSVDDDNNIHSVRSFSYNDYTRLWNPARLGSRPEYYVEKRLGNKRYLLLHPIMDDDEIAEQPVLKILRTRKIGNISSTSDTIELASEFMEFIIYKLASCLGVTYGIDKSTLSSLLQMSQFKERKIRELYIINPSEEDFIVGNSSYTMWR